jgi:hypothetical protein
MFVSDLTFWELLMPIGTLSPSFVYWCLWISIYPALLETFWLKSYPVTTRLSSSSTLLAGMATVPFGNGPSSERKRELEELIRVSGLHFQFGVVCFSMIQDLSVNLGLLYAEYIPIPSKTKRERVEALRRKLSNQPSLTAPLPGVSGNWVAQHLLDAFLMCWSRANPNRICTVWKR